MNDLTICICVYNGAKYIGQTLESLYLQTFQEFDLLIVNDCSTDSTVAVIDAFFDSHKRQYRVDTLPQNVGLACARKYAERTVQTEFLQFFDADDIALPAMVETLYRTLTASPDCLGVSCYGEYISDTSEKIGGGLFLGPVTPEDFFKMAAAAKLMFLPPVTMFRLREANAAGGRNVDGFPEGRPRYQDMCEDLDLWTRMSDRYDQGKYLLVVPKVLFRYRKFATSVSANSQAMNWRVRHIKTNLRRRRGGVPELNFIEYMQSVTPWQKFKFYFQDRSGDCYKQAGFCYMQKRYLRFGGYLIIASLFSPKYVMQKLTKNVLPGLSHKSEV